MSTHTIDTPMARRLVEAAAIRGAAIIGQPGGWSVMLKVGMQETPLGTQRTDKPRTWRSLDTCMQYLRDELKINKVDGIDGSNYSAEAVHHTKRSQVATERMQAAHKAAAYAEWLAGEIQAAIDDPRPSIPHEDVAAEFAGRRRALLKKVKAK